jgi:hypothetical protein
MQLYAKEIEANRAIQIIECGNCFFIDAFLYAWAKGKNRLLDENK